MSEKGCSRKLSFRLAVFPETWVPILGLLGNLNPHSISFGVRQA